MAVRLITDSGCDLPSELIQAYQITQLPFIVTINGIEYLDLKTIEPKQLYDAIRKGALPQTAQVAPHAFQEVFEEAAKAHDKCLYLAFSSGLSGTYQTAVMVKEQVLESYPDAQIDVIDTKAASTGHGLMVLHTAELLEENMEYSEITNMIHEDIRRMEHLFTVKDLDFLARGGRLSRTSAFVGGLLKVHPFLDVEDGKLVPREKIRGEKKLFQRFLEVIEERGNDLSSQTIAISHGDDLEAAEKLKQLIEERFSPRRIIITMIGSAIASHSGPGTLAVFFRKK